MVARTLTLTVILAIGVAGGGCRHSGYAGMKYDCCGPACGPGVWSPCGRCGDALTQRAVSCCDSGSQGCCSCRADSPFEQFVGSLCACSGCGGETYWSEWHNDPPCCEPCDRCGNFTGPNCCSGGRTNDCCPNCQASNHYGGVQSAVAATQFDEELFAAPAVYQASGYETIFGEPDHANADALYQPEFRASPQDDEGVAEQRGPMPQDVDSDSDAAIAPPTPKEWEDLAEDWPLQ